MFERWTASWEATSSAASGGTIAADTRRRPSRIDMTCPRRKTTASVPCQHTRTGRFGIPRRPPRPGRSHDRRKEPAEVFKKDGRGPAAFPVVQPDLLGVLNVFLELVLEGGGDTRIVNGNPHFEIQQHAARIEVRRADERPVPVDGEGLGMQDAAAVFVDLDSR